MEKKEFWHYQQPEAMAKCRERQKLYYQRRLNTVVHCFACNKSFNDFTIYKHWNTKKHKRNNPTLLYSGFPNPEF